MDLVDTHAHIQGPEFDTDRDEIIKRALTAGVVAIVVPGVDADTSEQAVRLAERHAGVYAAVGYHPHEASKMTPAGVRQIEALAAHPKTIAIGEIGLDFYRRHSPAEHQTEALQAMLDVADRGRLPVIVHQRDAAEAVWQALEPWARHVRPAFGDRPIGVMHYFSGDIDDARRYTGLGFLISIHTSVTHPKSETLRGVAREAPLETLVLETDSPYGAPQSHRGKRNEPALVVEAAAKVAEVRGTTIDAVAGATTANACRLFAAIGARAGVSTGASA